MTSLTKLSISGFRSIHEAVCINFQKNSPVVLVGENNAGKSNIVHALDLILGEMWPGSREPDDHDFWSRSRECSRIEITTEIAGLPGDRYGNPIRGFEWVCDSRNDPPVSFKTLGAGGYVSNELRDACICILVGADRRLSYQLSYTTKWTLLSKLMRKFHNHLVSDASRVQRLKEKFTEIKNVFESVSEFANFQGELRKHFGDMFRGMSYGLQMDFSAYDPSNFFHSLRVLPEEGGQVRAFDELGSGQEQLLALAFAHAYAKAFYGGIILVIEEPEAHLHPLAQQWLARQIRNMSEDGLQIVLTTHSPAFVDVLNLEGLALIKKIEDATNVKQLSADDLVDYCCKHGAKSGTSTKNILPFYSAHSTREILSGLFAKKVVLVEGLTEALALPIYLDRCGFDVSKEGVAVVPVGGKGNLAKWWRFFTAYSIPTFLTFDNDVSKHGDQNGTRRCDALGATGVAVGDIKRLVATKEWQITDEVCVFGEDFETCMRQSFPDYRDLETKIGNAFSGSKPLVARYVAKHLKKSTEAEGWRQIRSLCDGIKKLGV